jgi:hypothetical protein
LQAVVLGSFAVMLRQASFFALVEYEKSTLPQQKIRLPRLTAKSLQHQEKGVFCRDASSGFIFCFGRVRKEYTPAAKNSPSSPDGKIPPTPGEGGLLPRCFVRLALPTPLELYSPRTVGHAPFF